MDEQEKLLIRAERVFTRDRLMVILGCSQPSVSRIAAGKIRLDYERGKKLERAIARRTA